MVRRLGSVESPVSTDMLAAVRGLGRPLRSKDDLEPLLNRIGGARFVLLGEASHGTHEYYTWRAEISKRLIAEKGFSFIAVEGDWPDCYRVNRYVKGFDGAGETARDVLHAFNRWPTWMWANEEIVELAEWLRHFNDGEPEERKVGFYGLDVYSLWDSLHEVTGYLGREHPEALAAARKAFRCFEPYGADVQEFARSTLWVPEGCRDEAVALLRELRAKAPRHGADGRDGHFVAEQNALVVKNAEAYYRAMVRGGPDSWNVRDRHMAETLDRLVKHHGPKAKAIVWEHNTHVGDARYTDMAEDGMVNVGQLVREDHADDGVVLVGFGSHRGSVIAGEEWEAPMERVPVPDARHDSWEDVLHRAFGGDRLLVFDETLPEEMMSWRGHRAIGVVYRPQYEHYGNYVPTVLPKRYDAFLYVDQTRALRPLHMPVQHEGEVPETYPTGV
ncbi:MAG TPA: erythromycin esterase family protein [Gemmataceae bacterium]